MIDFTSQVAIVTGAGRGLGRLYTVPTSIVDEVLGLCSRLGIDP